MGGCADKYIESAKSSSTYSESLYYYGQAILECCAILCKRGYWNNDISGCNSINTAIKYLKQNGIGVDYPLLKVVADMYAISGVPTNTPNNHTYLDVVVAGILAKDLVATVTTESDLQSPVHAYKVHNNYEKAGDQACRDAYMEEDRKQSKEYFVDCVTEYLKAICYEMCAEYGIPIDDLKSRDRVVEILLERNVKIPGADLSKDILKLDINGVKEIAGLLKDMLINMSYGNTKQLVSELRKKLPPAVSDSYTDEEILEMFG